MHVFPVFASLTFLLSGNMQGVGAMNAVALMVGWLK